MICWGQGEGLGSDVIMLYNTFRGSSLYKSNLGLHIISVNRTLYILFRLSGRKEWIQRFILNILMTSCWFECNLSSFWIEYGKLSVNDNVYIDRFLPFWILLKLVKSVSKSGYVNTLQRKMRHCEDNVALHKLQTIYSKVDILVAIWHFCLFYLIIWVFFAPQCGAEISVDLCHVSATLWFTYSVILSFLYFVTVFFCIVSFTGADSSM